MKTKQSTVKNIYFSAQLPTSKKLTKEIILDDIESKCINMEDPYTLETFKERKFKNPLTNVCFDKNEHNVSHNQNPSHKIYIRILYYINKGQGKLYYHTLKDISIHYI
jgi:hypothetical protein